MQRDFKQITSPKKVRTGTPPMGLRTAPGWVALCLSCIQSKTNCAKKPVSHLKKRLHTVLIALLFAVLALTLASPLYAAITKVKDLGTNSLTSSGTTISVTVPAGGVAAGNSIIVTLAMGDSAGTVSCTDTAGNTYIADVDVRNTNQVRTVIFAAHNVSALSSGNTITITHPSIANRNMYAGEFSGLATSSTLDQATSGTGNGYDMYSGSVSTTAPKELLIGAIGVVGPTGDTFTHAGGWTALTEAGTTTITLNSQYQIVSSTGSYNAGGTNSSRTKFAAAIATYMAPPAILNQGHYRWRNNDDNEANATFTWPEDGKIYGIQKGTGIHRLRFLVSNSGDQNPAVSYQLQVNETATCSSAGYSAVPTDTSGDWQIVGSLLDDGVATSNVSGGLTDPGGYSWVAGEQEDNSNTTESITLDKNQFTEIEFSVQATNNATDSGDYCFKLVKSVGGDLNNYSVYAQAMIIPATAVTLAAFNARGENNTVRVDWETAQEIRNLGFNLYRSPSPSGPFVKINDNLIPGLIYSVKGKSYSYIDTAVKPGTLYYYKLEDIDASGKRTLHGPVCVDWDADGIPDDWEIAHGLNPWVFDADLDADKDGLTNIDEYELGFDPFNPDSDGDGIPDGQEGYRMEPADSDGSQALTRGVQLLAADARGVTLELSTDSFDTEVVTADGLEFERLRISEYIHGCSQDVGKPEVPLKGILLDIPQGQSAALEVLQTEVDTYTGYRVFPVPENIIDDQGSIAAVAESFVWNQSAYAIDEFYPAAVAELGDGFVFRGQMKQQLMFYPISFNPATGELRHYRKIRVRIDYEAATLARVETQSPPPWQLPIDSGAADSIAAAGKMAVALGGTPMMVNPLSPVLSSLGVLINALWSPDTGFQGRAYKILVEEEGIYRLSREYLAANGVDVDGLDLSELRIYNLGEEIAIFIYDENENGALDAADYVEFYAQPVAAPYAKYARYNAYWLVTAAGSTLPKRMDQIDGTPADPPDSPVAETHSYTVHYEQDEYYHGRAPGDDALQRWFFDDLVLGSALTATPDPVPIDFTINLPGVAGQGRLTISMWGYYNTYHDVEIQVNGVFATIANWSGIVFHEVTLEGIDLFEGDNIITLTCNRDMDAVIVDWFEVTYPRMFAATNNALKFSHDSGFRYQISNFDAANLVAFDITQATDTARVVNAEISGANPYTLVFEPPFNPGASETYLVLKSDAGMVPVALIEDTAADLANTANGADYILITHRDLGWEVNGDASGWLQDLAALRQAQDLRVKVVDVQDIFDEFSYGMTSAGAIRDFLTYAYNNWEPPAPQYVLLMGDSTYDFRDNLQLGITNYVPAYLTYTEFMGETVTDEWFVRISGSDSMPDLYIGRLPAESAAEAAVMVNKILTYETSPTDKTWQKNTLLIADDQEEAYEAAFETMNEDAANLLPTSMNAPFKGYLNYYLSAAGLTADIKDRINAGALIVNYSGHGSFQRWAGEKIFQNSDVDVLTNAGKYPFVINMSCLTGYFGYLNPSAGPEPSLAEAFLKADTKGAIATLMPTAMTSTGGQHVLDAALFEAIFQKDIRHLGPAIADAKQSLLANGGAAFEEISETFLLLGDPALALKVPIPHKPIEVEVQRTEAGVMISWQAVQDSDGNAVAGYNVYRSTSPGGNYIKINAELITETEFFDSDLGGLSALSFAGEGAGTYYYGVTSVDDSGDESARTLGSSPPAIGASAGAGGGGGCFVQSVSQSTGKQWIWLLVILTICFAISYRHKVQGSRRTVEGDCVFSGPIISSCIKAQSAAAEG
jgi:hypothetical protein